jgi:glycosyltransferase involved in cell wall biosynthesis
MSTSPSPPDVSVVIPTHNRVDYLEEAIASCFDDTTSLDIEVVVVNDGSSDGTLSYLDDLDDPRIYPIHQSPQGAQSARNKGMQAASGRYIKFLDDDDWLPPRSLSVEVARLEDSGADACHGRIRVCEEGRTSTRLAPETEEADAAAAVLRESMWTAPHKYLFRRDAIQALSWDPALPYHQDYAFLIEVACRGLDFTTVDQVVGVTRRHDGPRIADTKTAASPVEYYSLKVDLIKRGVRLLGETGSLKDHHRRAAAEGIWNWAHIVAAYDLDAFDAFYEEIQDLVPGFRPPRSRVVFQTLDALLGAKRTEHLLSPVRRMKNESSDVRA